MSPHTPSLRRALVSDDDPSREVAFARGGKRSLADLRHAVAAAATRVRDAGGGRWLLHTEDSFAACIGFFAIAHGGGVAVLPPNRQPETLQRLAADCVGAILEPEGDVPAGLVTLDPLASVEEPPALLAPLARDAVVAELRTSGTTGEGARIEKRLAHLEDEVATLEATFGEALDGTRVFATVSHQHIYGLLFRVLWPLASGRAFCSETPLHAQELLPRLREAGDCALVATPVHLKRLAENAELRTVRGACRAVFSSGGPLDEQTARAIAAALGAAPHEVLGSTETGGVATRQRDASNGDTWCAFPGVSLATNDEGCLHVHSPVVSVGPRDAAGRQGFVMGDRVELLDEQRFRLLGRADRTVKVGEKRLALPEMEAALAEHEAVDECALVVAPRAGEARVHAVVVASAVGRDALARDGRRGLGAALADHLSARWDRVLLPRAWRFVEALPRDAQGKLPTRALAALFEAGEAKPRIVAEQRDDERITRTLEIPADLAGIEGHFEGYPVVPGVMQIGWALEAAAELLGAPPRVRQLDGVKFPALLRPESRVELEVVLDDGGERLRFTLRTGDETTATGRCRLGEARRK